MFAVLQNKAQRLYWLSKVGNLSLDLGQFSPEKMLLGKRNAKWRMGGAPYPRSGSLTSSCPLEGSMLKMV